MSDGKTNPNKAGQKPDAAATAQDDAVIVDTPEVEEESLDFSQEGTSDKVSSPQTGIE